MAATRLNIVSCQMFARNRVQHKIGFPIHFFSSPQPDFHIKRLMAQMEKEIIGIGADQKKIFNRLRLFIDYFLLRNKADRQQLTDHVSVQIANYAKECSQDIRPIRVQCRMLAADLHAKFFASNDAKNCQSKSRIDDDDHIVPLDGVIGGDDAKGDHARSPIPFEDSSNDSAKRHDHKSLTKQESLLKPKAERISPSGECRKRKATSPPPDGAINLSRLKLKEALCKAKDKKDEPSQMRVKAKSVSPEPMRYSADEPKSTSTPPSLAQSTNSSSSEDIYEAIDNSLKEGDTNTVDKESFLYLFGLCTHSHSHFLRRRHTKRKRRNCNNGDYHYGRLDLFEKQYANKRNKRQFLYSPPATRAKKQRRVASDHDAISVAIKSATTSTAIARGPKPNATAAASQSGQVSAKVCVTCFKRSKYTRPGRPLGSHSLTISHFLPFVSIADNLLECKLCQGKYHAHCHIRLAHASCRENICPCCWRQKNRQYQQQRVQRKLQRAYHQINQIAVK